MKSRQPQDSKRKGDAIKYETNLKEVKMSVKKTMM
jgi:hypothetical protein